MHQDGRDEERQSGLSCRRRPGVAALLSPAPLHAAKNYNLNVNMDNAEHCSDLRVRSSNGEVAQTADTVTLGARDASMLEIDDNAGRGVVRVRGWDRPEYAVETCKIAVVGEPPGGARRCSAASR